MMNGFENRQEQQITDGAEARRYKILLKKSYEENLEENKGNIIMNALICGIGGLVLAVSLGNYIFDSGSLISSSLIPVVGGIMALVGGYQGSFAAVDKKNELKQQIESLNEELGYATGEYEMEEENKGRAR